MPFEIKGFLGDISAIESLKIDILEEEAQQITSTSSSSASSSSSVSPESSSLSTTAEIANHVLKRFFARLTDPELNDGNQRNFTAIAKNVYYGNLTNNKKSLFTFCKVNGNIYLFIFNESNKDDILKVSSELQPALVQKYFSSPEFVAEMKRQLEIPITTAISNPTPAENFQCVPIETQFVNGKFLLIEEQNKKEKINALPMYSSPAVKRNREDAAFFIASKSHFLAAASAGNLAKMKQLIQTSLPRINLINEEGNEALLCAVANGQTETVKFLLSKKVNSNYTGLKNRCALHWAARNGHSEIVSLLLKTNEILVNPIDDEGYTPLELAQVHGRKECIQNLSVAGGEIAHLNLMQALKISFFIAEARDAMKTVLDKELQRTTLPAGICDLLDRFYALRISNDNSSSELSILEKQCQEILEVLLIQNSGLPHVNIYLNTIYFILGVCQLGLGNFRAAEISFTEGQINSASHSTTFKTFFIFATAYTLLCRDGSQKDIHRANFEISELDPLLNHLPARLQLILTLLKKNIAATIRYKKSAEEIIRKTWEFIDAHGANKLEGYAKLLQLEDFVFIKMEHKNSLCESFLTQIIDAYANKTIDQKKALEFLSNVSEHINLVPLLDAILNSIDANKENLTQTNLLILLNALSTEYEYSSTYLITKIKYAQIEDKYNFDSSEIKPTDFFTNIRNLSKDIMEKIPTFVPASQLVNPFSDLVNQFLQLDPSNLDKAAQLKIDCQDFLEEILVAENSFKEDIKEYGVLIIAINYLLSAIDILNLNQQAAHDSEKIEMNLSEAIYLSEANHLLPSLIPILYLMRAYTRYSYGYALLAEHDLKLISDETSCNGMKQKIQTELEQAKNAGSNIKIIDLEIQKNNIDIAIQKMQEAIFAGEFIKAVDCKFNIEKLIHIYSRSMIQFNPYFKQTANYHFWSTILYLKMGAFPQDLLVNYHHYIRFHLEQCCLASINISETYFKFIEVLTADNNIYNTKALNFFYLYFNEYIAYQPKFYSEVFNKALLEIRIPNPNISDLLSDIKNEFQKIFHEVISNDLKMLHCDGGVTELISNFYNSNTIETYQKTCEDCDALIPKIISSTRLDIEKKRLLAIVFTLSGISYFAQNNFTMAEIRFGEAKPHLNTIYPSFVDLIRIYNCLSGLVTLKSVIKAQNIFASLPESASINFKLIYQKLTLHLEHFDLNGLVKGSAIDELYLKWKKGKLKVAEANQAYLQNRTQENLDALNNCGDASVLMTNELVNAPDFDFLSREKKINVLKIRLQEMINRIDEEYSTLSDSEKDRQCKELAINIMRAGSHFNFIDIMSLLIQANDNSYLPRLEIIQSALSFLKTNFNYYSLYIDKICQDKCLYVKKCFIYAEFNIDIPNLNKLVLPLLKPILENLLKLASKYADIKKIYHTVFDPSFPKNKEVILTLEQDCRKCISSLLSEKSFEEAIKTHQVALSIIYSLLSVIEQAKVEIWSNLDSQDTDKAISDKYLYVDMPLAETIYICGDHPNLQSLKVLIQISRAGLLLSMNRCDQAKSTLLDISVATNANFLSLYTRIKKHTDQVPQLELKTNDQAEKILSQLREAVDRNAISTLDLKEEFESLANIPVQQQYQFNLLLAIYYLKQESSVDEIFSLPRARLHQCLILNSNYTEVYFAIIERLSIPEVNTKLISYFKQILEKFILQQGDDKFFDSFLFNEKIASLNRYALENSKPKAKSSGVQKPQKKNKNSNKGKNKTANKEKTKSEKNQSKNSAEKIPTTTAGSISTNSNTSKKSANVLDSAQPRPMIAEKNVASAKQPEATTKQPEASVKQPKASVKKPEASVKKEVETVEIKTTPKPELPQELIRLREQIKNFIQSINKINEFIKDLPKLAELSNKSSKMVNKIEGKISENRDEIKNSGEKLKEFTQSLARFKEDNAQSLNLIAQYNTMLAFLNTQLIQYADHIEIMRSIKTKEYQLKKINERIEQSNRLISELTPTSDQAAQIFQDAKQKQDELQASLNTAKEKLAKQQETIANYSAAINSQQEKIAKNKVAKQQLLTKISEIHTNKINLLANNLAEKKKQLKETSEQIANKKRKVTELAAQCNEQQQFIEYLNSLPEKIAEYKQQEIRLGTELEELSKLAAQKNDQFNAYAKLKKEKKEQLRKIISEINQASFLFEFFTRAELDDIKQINEHLKEFGTQLYLKGSIVPKWYFLVLGYLKQSSGEIGDIDMELLVHPEEEPANTIANMRRVQQVLMKFGFKFKNENLAQLPKKGYINLVKVLQNGYKVEITICIPPLYKNEFVTEDKTNPFPISRGRALFDFSNEIPALKLIPNPSFQRTCETLVMEVDLPDADANINSYAYRFSIKCKAKYGDVLKAISNEDQVYPCAYKSYYVNLTRNNKGPFYELHDFFKIRDEEDFTPKVTPDQNQYTSASNPKSAKNIKIIFAALVDFLQSSSESPDWSSKIELAANTEVLMERLHGLILDAEAMGLLYIDKAGKNNFITQVKYMVSGVLCGLTNKTILRNLDSPNIFFVYLYTRNLFLKNTNDKNKMEVGKLFDRIYAFLYELYQENILVKIDTVLILQLQYIRDAILIRHCTLSQVKNYLTDHTGNFFKNIILDVMQRHFSGRFTNANDNLQDLVPLVLSLNKKGLFQRETNSFYNQMRFLLNCYFNHDSMDVIQKRMVQKENLNFSEPVLRDPAKLRISHVEEVKNKIETQMENVTKVSLSQENPPKLHHKVTDKSQTVFSNKQSQVKSQPRKRSNSTPNLPLARHNLKTNTATLFNDNHAVEISASTLITTIQVVTYSTEEKTTSQFNPNNSTTG